MILTRLNLTNFRNYKHLSLKLSPKINIFVGNNAQGKTNILESIYILAITKTHRAGLENNLIRFGCEKANIKGSIKDGKIIKDLQITFTKENKQVFLNKTLVKKTADYITNLNIISFSPDDLDIIKGSPSVRRNLLNIQLSQLSNKYLNYYNEYNKILKNRNEYLKLLYTNSIADENYLDILTDKLIERAVKIYQFRNDYINSINENINHIFEDISGIKNLTVKYEPNIDLDFAKIDFDEKYLKDFLIKKFKSNKKREISQGMTLFGPHRDDFSFYFSEENLKYFASQGQQRLAIICFKLAEIIIFKNTTNSTPILLLDDIFSEIDRKKKNRLLKYINNDIQTIITTTDLKDISKNVLKEASIYNVDSGIVTEKVGK